MAITFGASSAAASISQNVSSFSWSHAAGSTVKGVIVFTFTYAEMMDLNGNNINSVTYGGTALTAVSGGESELDSGQTQSGNGYNCKTWFLGSNVPTGTQTVVINRVNSAVEVWAVVITVNSSQNSATHDAGIVLSQGDGTLGSISEKSVTDGNSGTGNSLRVAGIICAVGNFSTFLDDPPSFNTLYPGANSTYRQGINNFNTFGGTPAMVVTETTTGTGSRNVGFIGDATERASVHLAIKDIGGGATAVVKDLIGGFGIIPFART